MTLFCSGAHPVLHRGYVDFIIKVERALHVLARGITVLCSVSMMQIQDLAMGRQIKLYTVGQLTCINKRINSDL